MRTSGYSQEQCFQDAKDRVLRAIIDGEAEKNIGPMTQLVWYLNMFGYKADQFNQLVLSCISKADPFTKNIGYSALVDMLGPDDEFTMMATNQIRKDLESPAHHVVGFALSALSLVSSETMVAMLYPLVEKHASSSRSYIRKKVVFPLVRMACVNEEYAEKCCTTLGGLLKDTDAGVIASSITCLLELARAHGVSDQMLDYVPLLHHILVNIDNNWVRIKCLKLLQCLYSANPRIELLVGSFAEAYMKDEGLSMVSEIATVCSTICDPKSEAFESARRSAYSFISHTDPNLKLIGLDTLSIITARERLSEIKDPDGDIEFVPVVKELADASDASIRRLALQVMGGMARGPQSGKICDKLMSCAIKERDASMIIMIADIMNREGLFVDPESLFLLGDIWRHSKMLMVNQEVISAMQQIKNGLSLHHDILPITIPVLDVKATDHNAVHRDIFYDVLSLLDERATDMESLLESIKTKGYNLRSFVDLLKKFLSENTSDSMIYLMTTRILKKMKQECPEMRADLLLLSRGFQNYERVQMRLENAMRELNDAELRTSVKKAKKRAALSTPLVEQTCTEMISRRASLTSQIDSAPWINMDHCLPYIPKTSDEDNTNKYVRTRDLFNIAT